MNPIVFYHAADLDGKCSAAIVKYYHNRRDQEPVELYGINYGDTFPWEKIGFGRKVYMVDFSLQPFSEMLKLFDIVKDSLIWIDHHKSAIVEEEKASTGDIRSIIGGIRDEKQAGCELTWRHLYTEENPLHPEVPIFVRLLGRYDTWDKSGSVFPWETILNFQYGMRIRETDLTEPEGDKLWHDLIYFTQEDTDTDWGDAGFLQKICNDGKSILTYEGQQNKMLMKHAFETHFEDRLCITCNRQPASSQIFDSIWNPEKYAMMIAFARRNKKWSVSLYSDRKDIDCGAIAKAHGGGGHVGAAGFTCDELPFEY